MARQFSDDAIRRIRRSVKSTEAGYYATPALSPTGSGAPLKCYIAKTGGSGIAARSGATPGSATVTLYYVNASGELATWNDREGTPITVTCYNMSTTAVGNNVYIIAQQELLSGKLLAVWEDC